MRLMGELATTGRLTRAGFWLRQCTSVPIALVFVIVASGSFLAVPLALFATVHLVSVWGRRLHDRDRSAWWLLATAVPVLGAFLLVIECGLRRSKVSRFGADTPVGDYLVVGATWR
jgi:uncharacterized membrane protein YhaH (DUF805 family)